MKKIGIDWIVFNGISDIDAIIKFTNAEKFDYNGDRLCVTVRKPTFDLHWIKIGYYVCKIGIKIVVLTKEEFDNL